MAEKMSAEELEPLLKWLDESAKQHGQPGYMRKLRAHITALQSEADDLRADIDVAKNERAFLQSEADRLREALAPFSRVAGELFARNWNRSDVLEIDVVEVLTAGDFFDARAALSATQQDATQEE